MPLEPTVTPDMPPDSCPHLTWGEKWSRRVKAGNEEDAFREVQDAFCEEMGRRLYRKPGMGPCFENGACLRHCGVPKGAKPDDDDWFTTQLNFIRKTRIRHGHALEFLHDDPDYFDKLVSDCKTENGMDASEIHIVLEDAVEKGDLDPSVADQLDKKYGLQAEAEPQP